MIIAEKNVSRNHWRKSNAFNKNMQVAQICNESPICHAVYMQTCSGLKPCILIMLIDIETAAY